MTDLLLRRLASSAAALLLGVFVSAGPAAAVEFGVYRGPGCDGRAAMPAYEAFVGRRVERTVDAFDQRGWKEFRSSIPWIVRCWAGSGIELTISLPMLTRDGQGTLAEGAAGRWDDVFLDVATRLVATRQENTIVRIGWEMNGDWQPWAAARDPAAFVAYFRRIVALMRSVEGQRFRFEWCPNLFRHQIAPDAVYPGDDVVDVIGLDVYNETWEAATRDPEERWRRTVEAPYGLAWHAAFASAHGKPTSFPEWGTGVRPDGAGAGDDPLFITRMAAWFDRTRPLYQSYWDVHATDYDSRLSDGRLPAAAAAFRKAFGTP